MSQSQSAIPYSERVEQALLGAILLDTTAIDRIAELISRRDFYNEAHRIIYSAMLDIYENGADVDAVTLAERINKAGKLDEIGGSFYIAELYRNATTAANVEQHSRLLLEYSFKRAGIQLSSKMLAAFQDPATDALELIERSERSMFNLAERRFNTQYTNINKIAHKTLRQIAILRESGKGGMTGITTGFRELDNLTGGFQNSEMIVIAGRPSMGKTALALCCARSAAVTGAPAGFFSIEMKADQIAIRIASMIAAIDSHKVRTGNLNQSDFSSIANAFAEMSELNIVVDDSPMLSVSELRAKARRMVRNEKVKIIFVDYLQLMSPPKMDSREREISFISQSLKSLAKELEIPVIAMAQLNRALEARSDKRPMLSDLRESGSIEQDADVVMFVHRPEYYKIKTYDDGSETAGTAEIIIGKQRSGPIGAVRLTYIKQFTKFENLSFDYEAPPPLPDAPDPADDEAPF